MSQSYLPYAKLSSTLTLTPTQECIKDGFEMRIHLERYMFWKLTFYCLIGIYRGCTCELGELSVSLLARVLGGLNDHWRCITCSYHICVFTSHLTSFSSRSSVQSCCFSNNLSLKNLIELCDSATYRLKRLSPPVGGVAISTITLWRCAFITLIICMLVADSESQRYFDNVKQASCPFWSWAWAQQNGVHPPTSSFSIFPNCSKTGWRSCSGRLHIEPLVPNRQPFNPLF